MSTNPAPGPSLRGDHRPIPRDFTGRSGEGESRPRETLGVALPPAALDALGPSRLVAPFHDPDFSTGRSEDRQGEIWGFVLPQTTGGALGQWRRVASHPVPREFTGRSGDGESCEGEIWRFALPPELGGARWLSRLGAASKTCDTHFKERRECPNGVAPPCFPLAELPISRSPCESGGHSGRPVAGVWPEVSSPAGGSAPPHKSRPSLAFRSPDLPVKSLTP